MDKIIKKVNDIIARRDANIFSYKKCIELQKANGLISNEEADARIANVINYGLCEYLRDIIRARADIICSKDMGFVSNYDERYKLVKEKSFYGEHRFVPVINNKMNTIVDEYTQARSLCYNIDNNADAISGGVLHLDIAPIENKSQKILDDINKDVLRSLDACVIKGFQAPAIKLLRFMSEIRLNASYEETTILTPLDVEELKDYLRKIIVNYAKKFMYKDSSSFLMKYVSHNQLNVENDIIATKLADIESNPKYVYKAIEAGKFGPYIDKSFIIELKALYKHTLTSMKDSAKVKRIAEIKEM